MTDARRSRPGRRSLATLLLLLALSPCAASSAGLHQPPPAFTGLEGIADNARTAAALLEQGLKRGAAPLLRVGAEVLEESPRLVALNFQDAANYDFYLERTDGVANAAGQLLWDPVYGGLIQGNPRTPDDAALCYEAVNGFRYTGREEYLRSRGNPARIEIASRNKIAPRLRLLLGMTQPPEPLAALFEITLEITDISHRPMADFVREVQAREREPDSLVHQSLFTLDPQALGVATFPAGSRFHVQLQTHFAKAGVEQSAAEFHAALRCPRGNDLPRPASALAAFGKPLRMKQSINGTAWDAMKAVLNIP
ncbi:hypothetical protein [Comamonas endophytica]|uniref:Uncharacterized protein n=1 Tax=Comamonas endophytica TaxID=2949090 RepID=A0ABY6GE72_9BURK|nr:MULTISPECIES: hypothetical protein [unclassified Acidovorax]MCD2512879.1 hypothetical protein [Acidovorax sp. D4N7]UYG52774.1 hypothetical protein M9799_05915 [Acidovorax sp. 5MLIR]